MVKFNTPVRMHRGQTILGLGRSSHWEIPVADVQAGLDYCRKEDSRQLPPRSHVFGWDVGQGQRSDLEAVSLMVTDGSSINEIATAYPIQFIKYAKGIRELAIALRQPYEGERRVVVLWGGAGTGKTREAMRLAEERGGGYHILEAPNVKGGAAWFDGYTDQKTLIIDDFYGWLQWVMLLRITDRYRVNVQTKGHCIPGCWDLVVITSNIHPNKDGVGWYKYSDRLLWAALERRISYITHVTPLTDIFTAPPIEDVD